MDCDGGVWCAKMGTVGSIRSLLELLWARGVAVGLCWGRSSAGFAHSLRQCRGGEALLRAHWGSRAAELSAEAAFPDADVPICVSSPPRTTLLCPWESLMLHAETKHKTCAFISVVNVRAFLLWVLFLHTPLPESSYSIQMPPNRGESHTKGALLSAVLSE